MARVTKLVDSLLSGGLLVSILLIWEVFSRFVFPSITPNAHILLPPPSAGVRDAIDLWSHGALQQHILSSAQRVYIGAGLAIALGVPLGLVMGLSKGLNAQLSPIIDGLRPIPPVAWIPISILWLGVTDTQQYFIIWIGAIFPIMLNTTAGVEQIDMTLKRAALSLGADAKGMFEVVLLGAMPSIFLGIRTSLGLAWFIIVAGEMVSAPNGLGYLLIEGRSIMTTERIYVGMFAIGLIGLLQDRFLVFLEERFMPWK